MRYNNQNISTHFRVIVANLARRSTALLKRFIIAQLGIVSDQKYYLDSFMVLPSNRAIRLKEYSPQTTLKAQLPASKEKFTYSFPPRFVYKLVNPILDPLSMLVYDSQGQIIAESSSWQLIRLMLSWPYPSIRVPHSTLPGTYIFAPFTGYYHWLIEDLPVILSSLHFCPSTPLLLPKNAPKYVTEALSLIRPTVISIDKPTKVEQIFLTGKTAGYGCPFGGLTPHPSDIDLLRKQFLPTNQTPSRPSSKIFLSRLGHSRSSSNEREIQELFISYGYEVVECSKLSFFDQISLFSRATHVAGLHGAAFANLVWCRPATVRVLEIFTADYLPACYSAIAHYLTLQYYSYYEPSTLLGANILIERLNDFCIKNKLR